LFLGCSKDLLDKELNYNPFDPEFVGDSPFEFVSATPITNFAVFPPEQSILVRFSVNESSFTSNPPFYRVRISNDQNWEDYESQTSNPSPDGIFEYEYIHPPESDCIYMALENDFSIGRQYSLCFEL
jgi:hypothetical protein